MSAAGSASVVRPVPTPSQTSSTPAQPARPSEVVLPRWQPDSEATYCPICGTQFSIFVRKHHCRKCGRVVCNSCSPHRITIPSQYIVRPPGTPSALPGELSLALLNGEWYPEIGGGERVRLCNPCVPDPNTAPPQVQGGQSGPQNNASPPVQVGSPLLGGVWSHYFGAGEFAGNVQTRSRSVTMQPGPLLPSRSPFPPPRSNEDRILWGTPPVSSSTSHAPRPHPAPTPHYRALTEGRHRPGPSSAAALYAPSSAIRHFQRPAALRRPAPQIAEEDECPVCHRELPPRTLPNFESLRESHITSCLVSHTWSGGRTSALGSGGGEGNSNNPGALPTPVPYRLTGMFPYAATEKDCVDSAECSICLEEFEVGVAMARLECLCRFHRACINAWWERHPGRCPMHQHDGYGF
ncbi:FYVE-domain-containing protein [Parathielavia appendiculata]|uniref:RING-type E3 ubiquitin transferase n=1 Tax=Parathielavia appendiculata TaxID=2587402 RepID=A0AAN6UAL4_9PEZI|nr:FYVE-domain-containing protein [Parathielavia appendiculata]